jgi:hypothetical protein
MGTLSPIQRTMRCGKDNCKPRISELFADSCLKRSKALLGRSSLQSRLLQNGFAPSALESGTRFVRIAEELRTTYKCGACSRRVQHCE